MLLWPLGLWRFFVTIFYLACCSCHRGFADAFGRMFEFLFCTLLLPRGFAGVCLSDVWVCLHAALAIGALQMLLAACMSFVLHAALAIGALRVLVCQMFEFVCMLLLPSGLCRCFWPHVWVFVLHAALAIGALRVLVCQMFKFICMLLLPSGLYRCFWPHVWVLFCMLLLPSGLCGCLFVRCLSLFACCSCHRGFADAFGRIIVILRNWLGNPANFKGTNKDQKIYVGRSTTLHNLLFCTHTLWRVSTKRRPKTEDRRSKTEDQKTKTSLKKNILRRQSEDHRVNALLRAKKHEIDRAFVL